MRVQSHTPPPPAPDHPRVRLIAHVDATAHDIAGWESSSVEAFEKASRPDVRVSVQLSHVPSMSEGWSYPLPCDGPPDRGRQIKAYAGFGLAGGLLLAGFAMGSRLSPELGTWGFLAGVAAAGYGVYQYSESYPTLRANTADWKGTRTYNIGADQTESLDSPPLTDRPETQVTAPELQNFVHSAFSNDRGDVNVFLVAGHGGGYWGCANFEVTELAKAIQADKPDLVVLESCLMSNLESMAELQGAARLAVASEQVETAGLGHWKTLLEKLPEGPLTAEALGSHIVQGGPRHGCYTTTLALVDVERAAELRNEIGKLADKLLGLAEHGRAAEIRSALEASQSIPEAPTDLRDLGSVLQELEDRGLLSSDELKTARGVFHEAVKDHWERELVSHLSIQGPGARTADYAKHFPEWSRLLDAVAPISPDERKRLDAIYTKIKEQNRQPQEPK